MAEFQTGVIRPVECMKEGWELIKSDYWLIFAMTLVGMLIAGIVPFGILIGAMFCGIYFALFKKMRGERIEFGDLFKGFDYILPGLVVSLVVVIPAIVSVVFIYGSMIAFMLAAVDSRGGMNEGVLFGMIATLAVEAIVISLVIGCIHALIMFAYPLVVDRNLGGIEAFKLSARAVWANLSGVVGIILLEFVMGLAGYLIFFVGQYLVLPIMFAGVLVAYRKVFPEQRSFSQPPPPYSYQDAGSIR